jgi:hypothetical protein
MSVCQWILLDTVGKKKPQLPYQQWGFWSLLDFFELPNGGGGGSLNYPGRLGQTMSPHMVICSSIFMSNARQCTTNTPMNAPLIFNSAFGIGYWLPWIWVR